MPDEDDIQVEAVNGLPERPPAGEHILWQGRPATWALARDSLAMYWVAGYFALLAVWRVGVSSVDMGFAGALPLAIPFLILGLIACGLILFVSWMQARATVYTITTARVAMRVGAALTVTLNLPFRRIASADLELRRDGTGTIALTTLGETRLSYLVLWPHVRPWRMKQTQPALRSVPDAERVARILAEAAETRVSEPQIAARAPSPMAAE
ncbi:photosynthetic complex putative assembly protein PuhB [Palleronia sp. KMU-117]|uniref:photosynthetic complex putative assembly protein PuhB n=1 Tax=Palleronia sp. KMU-117 TaxID=3434108 RepID=UPI003D7314F2